MKDLSIISTPLATRSEGQPSQTDAPGGHACSVCPEEVGSDELGVIKKGLY